MVKFYICFMKIMVKWQTIIIFIIIIMELIKPLFIMFIYFQQTFYQ
jgi:hypothetical protein